MIVLAYVKGYLASVPLSDRPINARRGVVPTPTSGNSGRLNLENASERQLKLIRRTGKALPEPVPFEQIWLSNGKHEVSLSFEELKEAWEFASRKREGELRIVYNVALESTTE